MFDLIPKNETTIVTMTSLELVDFINDHRKEGEAELRHDHFMAKVPKVLGADHAPKFRDMVDIQIGSGATRKSPIYRFPKREACLMAMSYSYDLQAKVFDKMTALEQKAAAAPVLPNFADPVAAARAWADAVELANGATAALSLAAPKAEALDRLTLADGAMCITNAAKTLGMQPKRLFAWMQANDWIYRRPGNGSWLAYQTRLKSLLLDHKVTTVNRADGTEKITEQVLVTAKGLAKLAQVVV